MFYYLEILNAFGKINYTIEYTIEKLYLKIVLTVKETKITKTNKN